MLLLIIFLITIFLASLYGTKIWIKIARKSDLTGKDMNKSDKNEIAESGGIIVIGTFALAVLLYISAKIFYFHTETHLLQLFALLTSLLLACLIGFVDDILGWKNGLRQWQKPLLTLPIAIPLAAINVGVSKMVLPFLGAIELGIAYPLLIVPLGIIGASNGYNMLAGLNGLESGLGIIIFSFLGSVAWISGTPWMGVVSFSMVAALLGFFYYNKFPSEVFPGDSMTYGTGALIAIIAILGSMEKIALFIFIPYILEFLLKMRSKFEAESFGDLKEDGTLEPKGGKIYSLTHIFMKKGFKERQIVRIMMGIEALLCFAAFIIFV